MVALQQTPSPTVPVHLPPLKSLIILQASAKLSLTSSFTTGIKLPKLTIKLRSASTTKRNRDASGTSMAETAVRSYISALADLAKSNRTLKKTTADSEKIE
ncbi:hypothetical protein M9H77_31270 [Catharanthus roseus]|uniref:Uncharacterized protein n=1 Tax=Catharanthus roseus TaxID=4058 RepID=A0ACC0A3V0_CATRO|nr:hypothetical protein M9H77_31270 [Catharanthus roseus]